jgi:hypothetical protein
MSIQRTERKNKGRTLAKSFEMSRSCSSRASDENLTQEEKDCAKRALVLLEFLGYTKDDCIDGNDPEDALIQKQIEDLERCWPRSVVILHDKDQNGTYKTETGPKLASYARQLRKELVGHHCSVKQYLLDPAFNMKEIHVLCSAPSNTPWLRQLLILAFAEEALGLTASAATNTSAANVTNVSWTQAVDTWRCCRHWLDDIFEYDAVMRPEDWRGLVTDLQNRDSRDSAKNALHSRPFHLNSVELLKRVCMNLALLYDHLSCSEKFCPDCLCKHALLAEAFTKTLLERPHASLVCQQVAPFWSCLVGIRRIAEATPEALEQHQAELLDLTCHFLRVTQTLSQTLQNSYTPNE